MKDANSYINLITIVYIAIKLIYEFNTDIENY